MIEQRGRERDRKKIQALHQPHNLFSYFSALPRTALHEYPQLHHFTVRPEAFLKTPKQSVRHKVFHLFILMLLLLLLLGEGDVNNTIRNRILVK